MAEGQRLDLGGVVGPTGKGKTLGVQHEKVVMNPGPRADMQSELAEAHTAMRMASEAMAQAREHIAELEVQVVEHAQNAADLWTALREAMVLVREVIVMADEADPVAAAEKADEIGAVLLQHEDQYKRPEPVLCPECTADKHPNCTKVIPVGDGDEVTPCGCTDDSHVVEPADG